jgi:hypothetical protein
MKAFLFIMSFFFSSYALAVTGDVSWTAKLNVFGKEIKGEGAKTDGGAVKDGVLSGDFKCDISTFKTGDTDRDAHMKEDLKTKDASLALDPVKLGTDKTFAGKLTIGNVTKPVAGTVSAKEFTFKIKLSEFDIKPRTMLGVKIEDDINIRVVLNL